MDDITAVRLQMLKFVTRQLIYTRDSMLRVGLALAQLEPENAEIVTLLEAEGAAVAGLMGHLERLTDELAGALSPERRRS